MADNTSFAAGMVRSEMLRQVTAGLTLRAPMKHSPRKQLGIAGRIAFWNLSIPQMMTIQKIRETLDERITQAREEASDSHKVAQNSYGAGYDRGYLDALVELLKFVNGETE